jgi:hypothetical protein
MTNLPAVPDTLDAEILDNYGPEVLTEKAAKALDKKIRTATAKVDTNYHALVDLLEEAAKGKIHVALDYKSWPAYVKDAVNFAPMNTIEWQAIVATMTGRGMSQRAIADALTVSKGTVQNDQQVDNSCPPDTVIGVDGKTQKREKSKPDAEPEPEQQVSDKPEPAPNLRSLATVFNEDVDELVGALATFVDMAEKNIADERFPKYRRRIADTHVETLQHCASMIDNVTDALTGNA